jgi:ectoine hydroxylase-related dioxygenase (phytanoyl-CoA dioxygenase family)
MNMVANCFASSAQWQAVVASVSQSGFAIVDSVLDDEFIARTREAMYHVQEQIAADVGHDRLAAAGELGVLRLMLRYHPHFFRFLELPALLETIDRTVSPTAIMHLQNGFVLPSFDAAAQPKAFQNSWHQDFPRVLNGYLASINMLFAIDPFERTNGATWAIPASHQRPEPPSADEITERAVALECAAGSMIIFDSTLWHAAGHNTSGRDRLAINHQFTRSWIKQQIDYVRALGDRAVTGQPPRTQQLLGWYTRVVTSLDDYYQPAERRLYRKGQG